MLRLEVLYQWWDIRVVHKPFRAAAVSGAGRWIHPGCFQRTRLGVLARYDAGEVDG